jgi:hypothetical protein
MLVLARTTPLEEVERESDGNAARMLTELRSKMQASVDQIGLAAMLLEPGA